MATAWRVNIFCITGPLYDKTVWSFIDYSDVILSATASQISGVSDVYSTICSGADDTAKLRATSFCVGNSPGTARLQYLQCVSNGDTAVLHQAIDMIVPVKQRGWYDDIMTRKRFLNTVPFLSESTKHRWIPLQNSSGVGLLCLDNCFHEQAVKQTVKLHVV